MQISIPDDEPRVWHDLGKKSPRAYEWFYLDLTEEADGAQMSMSLLAPNPFDLSPYLDLPGMPRCTACAPPNLPAPSRHVAAVFHVAIPGEPPQSVQQLLHLNEVDDRVAFQPDPWMLRVAGARLERTAPDPRSLPTYTLEFDVTDGSSSAAGKLTFQALQPEWMVPGNGLLFEQQTDIGHWHRWAVHVPRAVVNGEFEVSLPSVPVVKRQVVKADGYHDHNWGTRRPADAFQRWMWVRGSAGEHAVVAANLVPNPTAGYTDLRVSSLFTVLGSKGVSADIFAVVPGSEAAGLPFAKTIDVGPSPSAGAYRAVFRHQRIALEVPGFYQRRIAMLDLYDPAAAAPVTGWAVAETMLPQAIG
jgi:hypothetical protein